MTEPENLNAVQDEVWSGDSNVIEDDNLACCCEDWKKNIGKINEPTILQAVRTGSFGYTGKKFVYCPWCAKKLKSLV